MVYSSYRLQGPYNKNYLSDRSFTNVNDYEFVDNFATPDTARQIGKAWIKIINCNHLNCNTFIYVDKHSFIITFQAPMCQTAVIWHYQFLKNTSIMLCPFILVSITILWGNFGPHPCHTFFHSLLNTGKLTILRLKL